MKQYDVDSYFNDLFNFASFSECDPSKNGIQVENSGKNIQRAAFAVDACLETIRRAGQMHADMLFVHHGLFWGREKTITRTHFARIHTLIAHDLALFACHLPLDAHPVVGNNYGIAARLGLTGLEQFGQWRGHKIGVKGLFERPEGIDFALSALFPSGQKPLCVLPFGKNTVLSAGIVSGGAGEEVTQAIDEGLDLFITGEISHELYHTVLENNIHVVAGGHYQTETVGVQLTMKKFAADTGIDSVFIDVPTGL